MTSLGIHCLTDAAARIMEDRGITVVKPNKSVIIPSRRELALKRLDDFESELGRLKRLATELRADILALTIE